MKVKLDVKKLNEKILHPLNESLSNPKMIPSIVGLGIITPLLFPSIPAMIPIASKILIGTGSVVLGGFTAYVTIDTVKDLFNKEVK